MSGSIGKAFVSAFSKFLVKRSWSGTKTPSTGMKPVTNSEDTPSVIETASFARIQEAPLFTIIVPTFNEERFLPRLLNSIRQQTFQDYEVIVADDLSTDHTREIARVFEARVVSNNRIGEYPSRNVAAKVANGSILIFTGADVLFPPTLLDSLASKFARDPELAGVYCPTYPYDGALWAKAEFTIWYAFTTLLFWLTREANASTAFFAVRSNVFNQTRGFYNAAHADSAFSRDLSQRAKIRPTLGLVVYVSARRTSVGIVEFNRYHLAMIIDVGFRFLRKSSWLRAEKSYRIGLHTRSRRAGAEDRLKG